MSREPRIVGDLAYVPLNHGLEAIVGLADLPLVQDRTWTAHKNGGTVYPVTPMRRPDGGRSLTNISRVILGLDRGDPRQGDHINGNGLDNRRSNLRVVSKSQNQANSATSRSGTSRYKGVSWDKTRGKWCAQIKVDGKQTSLGRFTVETDAAHAYDVAAIEAWGEYARPNFPDEAAA